MRKAGQPPRGATLIELLVVLGILVLLAGVAVPMMRPALEGRRIREAARAVNVYVNSARNRGLETRRPAGVMLERMDSAAGASMILHQVEVPPPYGGDTTAARAALTRNGGTVTATLSGGFNASLVSAGDLIQFNNQGPWYVIDSVDAGSITASVPLRPGQMLPWSASPSQPVPYKILRGPTKSAATPLQLPMTTAIDLGYSGTDGGNFGSGDAEPVYIVFSGNGSLSYVQYSGTAFPVIDPIYLLVGRRENVGDAAKPNYADFNNIWIALNPQTGMVTTAPVVSASGAAVPADAYDSRGAARTGYSMGGQ